MTLHHLEIFAAVCQEKTMHAAAEKLNLSQPAISKAIADLERYYHIKLFERINHRLYLTPMGETLRGHAQHILELFQHMENDIYLQGQVSHIRIGASVSVGTCLLPPVIQRLQQALPITYEVTINNTSKIEQMINDYALDLALVEGRIDSPNLMVQDIAEDELVLAVSSRHPLAQKDLVTGEDLLNYAFITREDGSSQRNQLELRLQELGFHFHSNYSCSSVEAIKQALLYTDHVAALSRMMIEEELKKGVLAVLPFDSVRMKRSIRLIYHKNKYMTPAMTTFIDLLNQQIQQRTHSAAAQNDGNGIGLVPSQQE